MDLKNSDLKDSDLIKTNKIKYHKVMHQLFLIYSKNSGGFLFSFLDKRTQH